MASDCIIIRVGAAPPTANHIWANAKGGRVYLNKAASAYNKLMFYSLVGKQLPPDWQYVNVEILVAPTSARGDVDNRIKPVLDAITKARFWPDDSIVARVSCEFLTPEKRGRTIIRITKAESKYKTEKD